MRIFETLRTVDPSYGGPTEAVRQISGLMHTEMGTTVRVLSLDDPDSPHVKEFPLPVEPLGPAKAEYGYSSKFTAWIRAHLNECDLIVINGIWGYHSYGAYKAIRGSGKPYFVFTHGMLDPYFNKISTLKRIKKSIYWYLFERHCLQNATAVMFTCEEERQLARTAFKGFRCTEEVIAFGTADPQVDLEACKAEFLARFPAYADKRLVLFLSRIDPKKGIDLLIEAVADLRTDPDALYVIAGPDRVGIQKSLMAQAETLGVADRFAWPGMLTGNLKWGAFAACEVFMLPSHQENFGIVIAEAMACNKAVLTTNKVNIWREIEEFEAGFVSNDDKAGIKSLLQRWFALTPDDRVRMETNARNCFDKKFEAKQAARVIYEAYRRRTGIS